MNIESHTSSACWLLPEGIEAEDVVARLDGAFQSRIATDTEQRMVLHDTFAWQLWHEGLVLCELNDVVLLCRTDRISREEAVASYEGLRELPRFWWDWPDGALRDHLRELTGLRGLTPIAEVAVTSQRIHVLNDDEKTVARIVVQQCRHAGLAEAPSLRMCHIVGVRGYAAELGWTRAALDDWGLPRINKSPLELVLEQAGCRPTPWSAKPKCEIPPDLSSREATRRIATEALEICRHCENGIVQDLDTEFLHDYRVSLRRVRSALKLVKQVYPADATGVVIEKLGACARATNRLRDLDVYLLNQHDYYDCVPARQVEALRRMFADLAGERQEQQLRVSEHLQSDEYQGTLQHLIEFFDAGRWWPVTQNSHVPIRSLVDTAIQRRFKRIRRMGRVLTAATPDAGVHDIRLQAKKLRYLLELFAGAYPAEPVKQLVKRLKSVQSLLGAFNDLAVQQQSLQDYVRSKTVSQKATTDLVLAVGSLLGILFQRQQHQRRLVSERLDNFAGDETLALVREITGRGRKAA